MKMSSQVRDAILSYIFSLKVKDVANLQVAKTKGLMEQDEMLAKLYEGEISGYNQGLQEGNEPAKEVLNLVERNESELTRAQAKLVELQEDLASKDSDDVVLVGAWSIDDSWSLFNPWQEASFEIETTCDCDYDITTWTNGNCEFKGISKDRRKCSGKVEGKFMRGLYASVTLETPKKSKFAQDIEALKREIRGLEESCESKQELADNVKSMYKQFAKEIDLLENFIKEKRKKIQECCIATLPLEIARQRFEEFRAKRD